MSPRQRKIFFRDRSFGFASSVLVHAALLAAGGMIFARPIQYAVESGTGGMEVSLTAAPAELVAEEALPERVKEAAVEKAAPDPEDLSLPKQAAEERPPAEQKKEIPQAQAALNPAEKGDGSSPVPGKDATTFYSAGGALTEAQPNYLRNPAPPYPRAARDNGWEGLVVLKVAVDKAGRPQSVELEAASGHAVLDESALKTVRTWKFRPAQLGALPVASTVRVPVRFRLDQASS